MTVRELIQKLERLSEKQKELPICFAHTSGDYWSTVLLSEVEDIGEETRSWSGYHEKFKRPRFESSSENEQTSKVIVLDS